MIYPTASIVLLMCISDGGASIPIPVDITISGDRALIIHRLLTDCGTRKRGPRHRSLCCLLLFSMSGQQGSPANEGLMRYSDQDETQLNYRAVAPAAVAAGNVETSRRIVDALMQPGPSRARPGATCIVRF